MAKPTIKRIRKLLGKEAQNLTDEEIQRDIDTATLLKDLFFHHLKESRKNAKIKPHINHARK